MVSNLVSMKQSEHTNSAYLQRLTLPSANGMISDTLHKRLGGRGIGIHSLRKTAINDAIRNGATMHEVREFAGHADIRTTEVYFIRKEEDAEVAARRIQIRAH